MLGNSTRYVIYRTLRFSRKPCPGAHVSAANRPSGYWANSPPSSSPDYRPGSSTCGSTGCSSGCLTRDSINCRSGSLTDSRTGSSTGSPSHSQADCRKDYRTSCSTGCRCGSRTDGSTGCRASSSTGCSPCSCPDYRSRCSTSSLPKPHAGAPRGTRQERPFHRRQGDSASVCGGQASAPEEAMMPAVHLAHWASVARAGRAVRQTGPAARS